PDSITSQGERYDGVDPVLGPPFTPVFYQLFIDLPGTFANTPGTGNGALLYWTIPALTLTVQVVKSTAGSTQKKRAWFATSNNIAQASFIDLSGNKPYYIQPNAYIWFAEWSGSTPPTTPVGSGTLIGQGTGTTGTAYNGVINWANTDP